MKSKRGECRFSTILKPGRFFCSSLNVIFPQKGFSELNTLCEYFWQALSRPCTARRIQAFQTSSPCWCDQVNMAIAPAPCWHDQVNMPLASTCLASNYSKYDRCMGWRLIMVVGFYFIPQDSLPVRNNACSSTIIPISNFSSHGKTYFTCVLWLMRSHEYVSCKTFGVYPSFHSPKMKNYASHWNRLVLVATIFVVTLLTGSTSIGKRFICLFAWAGTFRHIICQFIERWLISFWWFVSFRAEFFVATV